MHFVSASFWKWHDIFMYSIYGIKETTAVDKTSIIIFGIKEKKLNRENSFYHVLIIGRATTTALISSITIFLLSHLWTFI